MIKDYTHRRSEIMPMFKAFEADDASYFDDYPYPEVTLELLDDDEMKESETYVYLVNDKPVGMVSYDEPLKTIHYLYVKEEYRNKGIALKLYEYLLYLKKDIPRIFVRAENKSAISFYKNQGFYDSKVKLVDNSLMLVKSKKEIFNSK